MRSFRALVLFVAFMALATSPLLQAQNSAPAQAIRAVLDKQVVDWNRGDLDAFATGYKNSPDILFIGSRISRGYAQMLDTYRNGYSTKEKMGTLSFTALEVQPLDERFATVTGNFHLERTAAGGGNADGYFLLVFEKTPAGWKIVRDDTTVPPKKAAQ
jgi:ketosteroid isomerase-like protein